MKATEELVKEHNAILGVLDVLETICCQIEQAQPFKPDDVGRILDFLKTFADGCHHQKEEQHLFPALERSGIPRERGPIGVMLAEHTLGRKHIRAIGEALTAYHAGELSAARAIAQNARAYINLLRAHILKENNVLFPLAERHLSAQTQEELVKAFDKLEEEEIGHGVHEQFHAMLTQLHNEYRAA